MDEGEREPEGLPWEEITKRISARVRMWRFHLREMGSHRQEGDLKILVDS